MPTRRSIRKPTRWTPEEWHQIQEAARARGVPPLRYVREAALAAELPPRGQDRSRPVSHELGRQLTRVLSNLHQLLHLAEEESAESMVAALESVIKTTEDAVRAASRYRGDAAAMIAAVVEAGRFLNGVTHGANASEALPTDEELGLALRGIILAVEQIPR
jgi:hypothetical protein